MICPVWIPVTAFLLGFVAGGVAIFLMLAHEIEKRIDK